jgi:murein endopeptidase
MQVIAREYNRMLPGIRLGINDMSLPQGGVFDIAGAWSEPHCSHKHGLDADIEQARFNAADQVVATVKCEFDTQLEKVVEAAGAKLQCESGGHKHINFP